MQSPPLENQLPRFYQIHVAQDLLEGWMLVKEWGHQGSPGKVKKEHYPTMEDAENAAQLSRDQQIKRGYRVVFVQGQRKPGQAT